VKTPSKPAEEQGEEEESIRNVVSQFQKVPQLILGHHWGSACFLIINSVEHLHRNYCSQTTEQMYTKV